MTVLTTDRAPADGGSRPGRRGRISADEQALRVPLDRLKAGPLIRQNQEADLELMAESIRVNGVLEPLLVREADGVGNERTFEILAGHRRAAAARLAGLTEVPARLMRAGDDNAVAIGLTENLCREAPSEAETVRAVDILLNTFGWSQSRISSTAGKSRGWISEITAVVRASKRLSGAVESGQAGITTAAKIARLKDTAPDVHDRLVERLARGERLANDDVPTISELVRPGEPPRPGPAPRSVPNAYVPAAPVSPAAPASPAVDGASWSSVTSAHPVGIPPLAVPAPQQRSDPDGRDGRDGRAELLPGTRRPYQPVTLPPGLEAQLARDKLNTLRTMGQIAAACRTEGNFQLPTPVRQDLLAIQESVGALLDQIS